MLNQDRQFMELAIKEASLSEHGGPTDPKVGAVIVQEGEPHASAHRGQIAKGDHAEFTLLQKILRSKDLTAGTTLYTTLEPCTTRSHDKRPCAEWIVAKGIRRVVIGILDPNPTICGRGYWHLKDANIEVEFFPADLAQQIIEHNRGFIEAHRGGPRITASFAWTIQRMKSATIAPYAGLGWGDALYLQDCPRRPEGWSLSQIEVRLEESPFALLDKHQTAYADYWRRYYDEKRFKDDGEKFMLRLNPTAFSDSPSLCLEMIPTRYSHIQFYQDSVATIPSERNPLIEDLVRGSLRACFPHSVGMHMIVVTDDDKILLTRRSSKVGIHPKAWSASVEEQLSRHDLGSGTNQVMPNLARRLLNEELSLDADAYHADNMRLLSVFLEADILNVSLCALGRIRLTSQRLDTLLRASPRTDYEFTEWQFLALEKVSLLAELLQPSRYYLPTTGYRLLQTFVNAFGSATDADLAAYARS